MTPNPVTVSQTDSIQKALRVMEHVRCHHLPVISWDGHAIGMLAYHDCLRAVRSPLSPQGLFTEDELAQRLTVGKVMVPAPISVERSTPIEEAIRLMLKESITSVLVMNDETLVGILTASDIMKAYLNLSEKTMLMQLTPCDDAAIQPGHLSSSYPVSE
jgi:acetoin utilization protein AcuB